MVINLNKILDSHKKWLNKKNSGKRANLSNVDLRCAKLIGVDLSSANLRNAELRSAKLIGANFRGANLRNADLSNANLRNANFRNADLSNADLSNAKLISADLSNADLSNANLSNADLNYAKFIGADLSNVNLSNANLSNANLSVANLTGIAVKLFQAGMWTAIITPDQIYIGCQKHCIDKWAKFKDEEISAMHADALPLWKENKVIILEIAQSMQVAELANAFRG